MVSDDADMRGSTLLAGNKVRIYGLTRVTSKTKFCDSGDSGAPVFFQTSVDNVLCGLITGYQAGGDGYYSFITPMYYLIQDGFVPYNLSEYKPS